MTSRPVFLLLGPVGQEGHCILVELWKFINSFISSKRSVSSPPTKIKVDNTAIANLDEIAELFNNYFVEIGHLIAKSVSTTETPDFKSFLKNPVSQTIVLEPPHPIEVFNAINSLNLHKASGYDISSFFLRLGNEILAPILSVYFGVVFELGFFSQIFKTAKVVPIFKAGDKHLVRNYCPISLLSCLSKVLEKIIKNRFMNFFEKHEIFYDFQYGFREKRSVMHALLDVLIPVYDAIEHNKFTALLMDLRKAFATVSHQKLLQKPLHYGIRGPAYSLIESYLSNRQQFVSINNSASSLKSISIGLPQGSIFGPLLFLIYVNDLTNATFCQPRLFADDTCLALNNSSLNALEVNSTSELRRLRNWCNANELQINPEKSTIIIFPPKLNLPRPEVNFIYNTSFILLCDSAKYLGVTIDSTLNFKPHIIALEKRV